MRLVRAGREHIDRLVELRAEVLLEANGLPANTDMSEIKKQTRRYYETVLGKGTHIEYLAFEDEALAGCGALCLYSIMPTCLNPTGHRGYIMNMYTRPVYRRQGIARAVLNRLLLEARQAGLHSVQLEATKAGRPLYTAAGFYPLQDEMSIHL